MRVSDIVVISLAALALTLIGTTAYGQQMCRPPMQMPTLLYVTFGEYLIADMLHRDGSLLRVYATENGSTWTVTKTDPNGLECVLSSGEHFRPNVMPTGAEG